MIVYSKIKKTRWRGKRTLFRNRNQGFKLLVVNCRRILNKILNFEQHVEIVNPDINLDLHSFIESGIDLWNSLSITT